MHSHMKSGYRRSVAKQISCSDMMRIILEATAESKIIAILGMDHSVISYRGQPGFNHVAFHSKLL